MKFVCLGNTGDKYKHTRHNVGKKFGEFLCQKLETRNSKFENSGRIVELENGWRVIFLDCLMNNSGPCLRQLLKITSHKPLVPSRLWVVHDDMDISFGEFKIQKDRGAAGHKGVESVINALGTKDFGRIRIGIGRPPKNIPPENFVLMPFNQEEREKLEQVFNNILKNLKKM